MVLSMEKVRARARLISPTLGELKLALEEGWKQGSQYWYKVESGIHPSLGCCRETALVVQDYFGGQLLYVNLDEELEPPGVFDAFSFHYWNLLARNQEVDLTIEQFSQRERSLLCTRSLLPPTRIVSREEIFGIGDSNDLNAYIYLDRQQEYEVLARSVFTTLLSQKTAQ